MVFQVVMYGCENWTTKKAEHKRIVALKLWCWWRRLKVPWTARRSNQSILREINPEYLLEGLMLKLKVHSIGHVVGADDSLEKSLMLGKIEGRRRKGDREWDGWMTLPMQCTQTWGNFIKWWQKGTSGTLWSMGLQIQLGKCTTTISWDKAVPGRVEEENVCENNGRAKFSPRDGGSG